MFSYPFSASYPKNCCESVSLIFYYLMKEKYPSAMVRIVHGTKAEHEDHFWLEVDGLIFDLTAHQFENVEAPILGEKSSSLTEEYQPDGEEPRYDFVHEGEIVALHRCGCFDF